MSDFNQENLDYKENQEFQNNQEFNNNQNSQNNNAYYYYPKTRFAVGKHTAKKSLIQGVVSLVFFCAGFNLVLAIFSIANGAKYLAKKEKEARGMAIAGMAAAVASVVLFFGCWNVVINNEAFLHAMQDLYSIEDMNDLIIEGEEL